MRISTRRRRRAHVRGRDQRQGRSGHRVRDVRLRTCTSATLRITVTATSTSPTAPPSGIAIVFSSLTPSTCTTSGTNGATLTLVAAGTCTIAANEAGDASYNAAPQVTLSFTIAGAGPSAQFAVTGDMHTARSDHTATLLEDGRVLLRVGSARAVQCSNTCELYCPDNASEPPTFAVCPAGQRGTFTATLTRPACRGRGPDGDEVARRHRGTDRRRRSEPSAVRCRDRNVGGARRRYACSIAPSTRQRFLRTAGFSWRVASIRRAIRWHRRSSSIWSTTPPTLLTTPDLAFARESHTATLLPDGTVLIAGGRRKLTIDFAVVGEYELYDPSGAGPLRQRCDHRRRCDVARPVLACGGDRGSSRARDRRLVRSGQRRVERPHEHRVLLVWHGPRAARGLQRARGPKRSRAGATRVHDDAAAGQHTRSPSVAPMHPTFHAALRKSSPRTPRHSSSGHRCDGADRASVDIVARRPRARDRRCRNRRCAARVGGGLHGAAAGAGPRISVRRQRRYEPECRPSARRCS